MAGRVRIDSTELRDKAKELTVHKKNLLECVRSEDKNSVDELRAILNEGSPWSHDSELNRLCKDGEEKLSPLHYAVRKGKYEKVLLLLTYRAQVNYKDETKMVLDVAIDPDSYDERIVLLLVEKYAIVTPELFFEVVQKKLEVVARAMFRKHKLRLLRKTFPEIKKPYLTRTNEDSTVFRELIRFMPDLAKEVLDECIPKNTYHGELHNYSYNHEFIEDFQTRRHASKGSDIEGGREVVDDDKSWGPAKFTKHNHPLSIMVRHKRVKLLDHDVVTSLIHQKWQKFGFLSYVFVLIFFAFYLIFLTSFALVLRNPQANTCVSMYGETNSSHCPDYSMAEKIYPVVSAILVIIMSITKLLIVLTSIMFDGVYFFKELSNWIKLILFPCSIIFVAMPNWVCPCVSDWQWQVGAVTILLAWLDFVLYTSKIPIVGLYVLMFVEICKTFVKLSFFTILLVVTFGLTFFMIYSDPQISRSSFGSGFRSLMRTLVMMTGEMNYDGIFRLDTSDPDNDRPELAFLYTAYITWVPFVILIPLLFTNLLIGLATGDVGKVQKEAEFRLRVQHIDQILTVEQYLPCIKRKARENTFTEGEKTPLQKFVHRLQFLGWDSQYDDFQSVQKILKQEMSDLAQIKRDIAEIKRLIQTN